VIYSFQDSSASQAEAIDLRSLLLEDAMWFIAQMSSPQMHQRLSPRFDGDWELVEDSRGGGSSGGIKS
jgi:hypothetical protein